MSGPLDGSLQSFDGPAWSRPRTNGVADLAAAALPDQHLIGDTEWTGSDHVWDFVVDSDEPDTSIRVVIGFPDPPTETEGPTVGLYEGAASFWFIDPSGIAIRISSTDPGPESVDRLTRLAADIAERVRTQPSD